MRFLRVIGQPTAAKVDGRSGGVIQFDPVRRAERLIHKGARVGRHDLVDAQPGCMICVHVKTVASGTGKQKRNGKDGAKCAF